MQEKDSKTLFRNSAWAAVPLFVYLLISLASSVLVAIGWMTSTGLISSVTGDWDQFRSVLQEKLSEDYVFINIANMVVQYIFMIPIFGYMMLRDERKLLLTGKIRKVSKIPTVWYLLIIAAAAAVCIAGTNLICLSGLTEESDMYQVTAEIFAGMSLPVRLLLTGLVAPVSEELLFRGLIYKRFRLSHSMIMAMIWSSLIFALLHGNMVQGIYGFVVGMIMCFVYYRYGTILAPILFHISANTVSVLSAEFIPKYPGLGTFFGVTFACFAVIILCLYMEEVYVRPISTDVFIETGEKNKNIRNDYDSGR